MVCRTVSCLSSCQRGFTNAGDGSIGNDSLHFMFIEQRVDPPCGKINKLEVEDLLFLSVFQEGELVRAYVGDEVAVAIRDDYVDSHPRDHGIEHLWLRALGDATGILEYSGGASPLVGTHLQLVGD